MSQTNNRQPPQEGAMGQPKLSIDEQVSLLLAHVNRSVNTVSKEIESALIKVVSQLLESQKKYADLTAEFDQYKKLHPFDTAAQSPTPAPAPSTQQLSTPPPQPIVKP